MGKNDSQLTVGVETALCVNGDAVTMTTVQGERGYQA